MLSALPVIKIRQREELSISPAYDCDREMLDPMEASSAYQTDFAKPSHQPMAYHRDRVKLATFHGGAVDATGEDAYTGGNLAIGKVCERRFRSLWLGHRGDGYDTSRHQTGEHRPHCLSSQRVQAPPYPGNGEDKVARRWGNMQRFSASPSRHSHDLHDDARAAPGADTRGRR